MFKFGPGGLFETGRAGPGPVFVRAFSRAFFVLVPPKFAYFPPFSLLFLKYYQKYCSFSGFLTGFHENFANFGLFSKFLKTGLFLRAGPGPVFVRAGRAGPYSRFGPGVPNNPGRVQFSGPKDNSDAE